MHSLSTVVDPGTNTTEVRPEGEGVIAASGKEIPESTSASTPQSSPRYSDSYPCQPCSECDTKQRECHARFPHSPDQPKPPRGGRHHHDGERGEHRTYSREPSRCSQGTIYFPGAIFPDEFYTLKDQAHQARHRDLSRSLSAPRWRRLHTRPHHRAVTMADFISVSDRRSRT
jgi:hypothetical protein